MQFRTVRAIWLGIIVISVLVVFLLVCFSGRYLPRGAEAAYWGALILSGLPSLCVTALILKNIRAVQPQAVVHDIALGLFIGICHGVCVWISLHWLQNGLSPRPTHTLVSLTYSALFSAMSATWYTVTVLYLTIFTRIFVDRDILRRDITATPSPLSVGKIIEAMKKGRRSSRDCEGRAVCLPGCQCVAKLPPPYSPPPMYATGPIPAVRLPSQAELNRAIVIGFGECQRGGRR